MLNAIWENFRIFYSMLPLQQKIFEKEYHHQTNECIKELPFCRDGCCAFLIIVIMMNKSINYVSPVKYIEKMFKKFNLQSLKSFVLFNLYNDLNWENNRYSIPQQFFFLNCINYFLSE